MACTKRWGRAVDQSLQVALIERRSSSPLNHMRTVFLVRRATLLVGALLLAACGGLPFKPAGTEVVMMTSGGFAAASDDLKPGFERSTGISVKTVYGSSMGGAADSIPSRLARNEPFDVVILARTSLDELVAKGKVLPGSQVSASGT